MCISMHNSLLLLLPCCFWVLICHLNRLIVYVSLAHRYRLTWIHWHRDGLSPWTFIGHRDLVGVLWLQAAHKLLNDDGCVTACLLVSWQKFVQHLHSSVDPTLLHLDLLVKLHDLLHELHHSQVLNRNVTTQEIWLSCGLAPWSLSVYHLFLLLCFWLLNNYK